MRALNEQFAINSCKCLFYSFMCSVCCRQKIFTGYAFLALITNLLPPDNSPRLKNQTNKIPHVYFLSRASRHWELAFYVYFSLFLVSNRQLHVLSRNTLWHYLQTDKDHLVSRSACKFIDTRSLTKTEIPFKGEPRPPLTFCDVNYTIKKKYDFSVYQTCHSISVESTLTGESVKTRQCGFLGEPFKPPTDLKNYVKIVRGLRSRNGKP